MFTYWPEFPVTGNEGHRKEFASLNDRKVQEVKTQHTNSIKNKK